jgi:probable HAF family extracellular repeat protein
MQKQLRIRAALCIALAAAATYTNAQTISFTTVRLPTNVIDPNLETRGNPVIRGLNDRGDYVGMFGERNSTIWGLSHGFVHTTASSLPSGVGTDQDRWGPNGYRLGEITGTRYAPSPLTLERFHYLDLKPDPWPSTFNAGVTTPYAINNSGLVVGRQSNDWLDRGPGTAFVFNSRTGDLQTLNVPGATTSYATDINNSGQIVGNFTDATGDHGFLYSGGTYTVIDMPGEVGRTRIGGINDLGTIVGSAYDYANLNSFIYRNGTFTNFTADNRYTVASDINNNEQIVGWVGVSGKRRGFLYEGGQTTILDFAGEASGSSTYAYTINNLGVIGGLIENRTDGGFLATVTAVPEPASYALWLMGLVGVFAGARKTRRTDTELTTA